MLILKKSPHVGRVTLQYELPGIAFELVFLKRRAGRGCCLAARACFQLWRCVAEVRTARTRVVKNPALERSRLPEAASDDAFLLELRRLSGGEPSRHHDKSTLQTCLATKVPCARRSYRQTAIDLQQSNTTSPRRRKRRKHHPDDLTCRPSSHSLSSSILPIPRRTPTQMPCRSQRTWRRHSACLLMLLR